MRDHDSEDFTATSNDPKHQKRDNPGFSPGAGCIIIMMIIALFTGVAAFAIYSGIKQDRDIVGFTYEKALELPDEAGSPEELEAVRAKLESFQSEIRAQQASTLELSPRDVNILIHNQNALMDIRDMIFFESVTPEGITGRISLPLNRLAFWKPRRYLNGKFTMALEASPGRLFLRLRGIDAPGKDIPAGFVERIAQDDLLDPYKNEENEDIFFAIESAAMTDGAVTIKADPNRVPGEDE